MPENQYFCIWYQSFELMEEVFPDYGIFENKGNDKIVCFNISRTYLLCERPSVYDCTRKYWRLNKARAENADLVFGVCSGIIIGVFKPARWFLTDNPQYHGRYEFEGEEIKDSPFINMSIAHLMGKRQNPVMYINM